MQAAEVARKTGLEVLVMGVGTVESAQAITPKTAAHMGGLEPYITADLPPGFPQQLPNAKQHNMRQMVFRRATGGPIAQAMAELDPQAQGPRTVQSAVMTLALYSHQAHQKAYQVRVALVLQPRVWVVLALAADMMKTSM